MSFMDTLKGFGGWVAKSWQKIFNAAPAIEHVADTVFAYVVPALTIILGMVAPEEAVVVTPIINEIQKAVAVVSGLIFDFGANPTTVNMVQAIEKDLADLLAAGHIKDAGLVAKIEGVVKTISTLATALASK
jgi:hypothetical protein